MTAWLAAVALACVVALGGALIDRMCALDFATLGPARWVARLLLGLLVAFALALHPLAALLLGATLALARRWPAARHPTVVVVAAPTWVAFAVVVALSTLRPLTPIYWDEWIWLAKSRLFADGPRALVQAALDPAAGVVPAGYPLFWSWATGLLAWPSAEAPALVAAAGVLVLACWGAFLAAFDSLVTRVKLFAAVGALGLLLLTPMVVVHARARYVDLPVGLLAATLTLAMCASTRTARAWPALVAAVLVACKDEGLVHALAVMAAVIALGDRSRVALRRVALPFTAALATFGAWRALLVAHGVEDGDHQIGAPAFDALADLTRALAGHLLDLRSWGLLWPVVLGAAIAVGMRSSNFAPRTRQAAAALAAQAVALAAVVLCGPERVQVFATSGTLINRLLVQLAPAACVVVALVATDLASDESSRE